MWLLRASFLANPAGWVVRIAGWWAGGYMQLTKRRDRSSWPLSALGAKPAALIRRLRGCAVRVFLHGTQNTSSGCYEVSGQPLDAPHRLARKGSHAPTRAWLLFLELHGRR